MSTTALTKLEQPVWEQCKQLPGLQLCKRKSEGHRWHRLMGTHCAEYKADFFHTCTDKQ